MGLTDIRVSSEGNDNDHFNDDDDGDDDGEDDTGDVDKDNDTDTNTDPTDQHRPGCKSQHHGLRGRYQLLKTNPLLFVDLVSIFASNIFVLRIAASDEVIPSLFEP